MDKEIIGITGGIGSGKSVVSRILRLNGFPVYDCDFEAKSLMTGNEELRREICRLLGKEAFLECGRLDNSYVASRIFSDSGLLRRMNTLVHGAVRKHFLAIAESTDSGKMFCESAILASSGFSRFCSSVWLVTAPADIRVDRVMRRNGMKESEVRQRMESQKDEEEMLDSENLRVILNDGEKPLLPQIMNLLQSDIIKTEICSEKF